MDEGSDFDVLAAAEQAIAGRKRSQAKRAEWQREWQRKLAFRDEVIKQATTSVEPPPPPQPPKPTNMKQASGDAVKTPWGWRKTK